MLTGEGDYVVGSVFSMYHLLTKIASHYLFPLFFKYSTVDFNSIRKWISASFITKHIKVPYIPAIVNRSLKTVGWIGPWNSLSTCGNPVHRKNLLCLYLLVLQSSNSAIVNVCLHNSNDNCITTLALISGIRLINLVYTNNTIISWLSSNCTVCARCQYLELQTGWWLIVNAFEERNYSASHYQISCNWWRKGTVQY